LLSQTYGTGSDGLASLADPFVALQSPLLRRSRSVPADHLSPNLESGESSQPWTGVVLNRRTTVFFKMMALLAHLNTARGLTGTPSAVRSVTYKPSHPSTSSRDDISSSASQSGSSRPCHHRHTNQERQTSDGSTAQRAIASVEDERSGQRTEYERRREGLWEVWEGHAVSVWHRVAK
jgi:hypothetical protein